jgi:hypothetical protein
MRKNNLIKFRRLSTKLAHWIALIPILLHRLMRSITLIISRVNSKIKRSTDKIWSRKTLNSLNFSTWCWSSTHTWERHHKNVYSLNSSTVFECLSWREEPLTRSFCRSTQMTLVTMRKEIARSSLQSSWSIWYSKRYRKYKTSEIKVYNSKQIL